MIGGFREKRRAIYGGFHPFFFVTVHYLPQSPLIRGREINTSQHATNVQTKAKANCETVFVSLSLVNMSVHYSFGRTWLRQKEDP